jgi:hypothetical protein
MPASKRKWRSPHGQVRKNNGTESRYDVNPRTAKHHRARNR